MSSALPLSFTADSVHLLSIPVGVKSKPGMLPRFSYDFHCSIDVPLGRDCHVGLICRRVEFFVSADHPLAMVRQEEGTHLISSEILCTKAQMFLTSTLLSFPSLASILRTTSSLRNASSPSSHPPPPLVFQSPLLPFPFCYVTLASIYTVSPPFGTADIVILA